MYIANISHIQKIGQYQMPMVGAIEMWCHLTAKIGKILQSVNKFEADMSSLGTIPHKYNADISYDIGISIRISFPDLQPKGIMQWHIGHHSAPSKHQCQQDREHQHQI